MLRPVETGSFVKWLGATYKEISNRKIRVYLKRNRRVIG